tara:strand:+ start:528 stop:977 length:450 start_codon:yes stop_codon:yes gene_type:complete
MKDKGLGDTIERFTKATGIKKIVDKIPGDCGCNKRKDKLNNLLPYSKSKKKLENKFQKTLRKEIKIAKKKVSDFGKNIHKNGLSGYSKEEFQKEYQDFVNEAYKKVIKMQSEVTMEATLYDGTVISGLDKITEVVKDLEKYIKIDYEQT